MRSQQDEPSSHAEPTWARRTWSEGKRRWIAISAILFAIVVALLLAPANSNIKDLIVHHEPSLDARNATFGFQKIFYISLPYRTDRQDAMTLLSEYTEIDTIYTPGVRDVNDTEKIIATKLRPAEYGCWRSHANIWRRVLSENLATALIFEDDVDWDVNIKDQLFRLSQGLHANPDLVTGNKTDPYTPYGSSWDIFALGYCKHWSPGPDENDGIPVITVDDPWMSDIATIIPAHAQELERLNVTADHKHAMTLLNYWFCTHAYAVTRAGAARLLYLFGYDDFWRAIDVEMSDATAHKKLRGIVPVPPLVAQFKLGTDVDTDIQRNTTEAKAKEEVDKETGISPAYIKRSARKEMKLWTEWGDEGKPDAFD